MPPASLTGNLTLWLDSRLGLYTTSAGSTPATADGDPVGKWEDQSGAARNFTIGVAGQRPTLQLAEINNLPALEWDGTDDRLNSAAALSAFINTAAYTVYIVAKPTTISTNSATIYENDPLIADQAANWGLHLKSAPTAHGYHLDSGAARITTSTPVINTWQVYYWRYNGANVVTSIGAGAENSVAATLAVNNPTQPLRLGANYNAGQLFAGQMAQVLIYNAGHDAAQKAAMLNYFSQLYGL